MVVADWRRDRPVRRRDTIPQADAGVTNTAPQQTACGADARGLRHNPSGLLGGSQIGERGAELGVVLVDAVRRDGAVGHQTK